MVDIHSHILPAVDDGADSWETAVEMCRLAAADGIDHMVATPHANEEFSYDRAEHEATLAQLRQMVPGRPLLSLGCDFHFSYENLEDVLASPRKYVIGYTNYLLIELSDFIMPRFVAENLVRLLDAGLTPILTHPERNLMLQRDPGKVLEWAENGCIVQVTASALTGLWGKKVTQLAHWFIQHEAVHVLATDAHNLRRRTPVLSQARDLVAEHYGADLAEALVERNPRAIVEGLPLPYFPKPVVGR
jgi:protein-tyrosine phosphatase